MAAILQTGGCPESIGTPSFFDGVAWRLVAFYARLPDAGNVSNVVHVGTLAAGWHVYLARLHYCSARIGFTITAFLAGTEACHNDDGSDG